MELLPNTLKDKNWSNNSVRGLYITNEHGGGCCGIVHLHDFPTAGSLSVGVERLKDVTVSQRVEWINKAVAEAVRGYTDDDELCGPDEGCDECDRARAARPEAEPSEGCTWHCAVEVVLAEYQRPEWEASLKKAGFSRVFDFLNSNSGNRCYVYYHETGGKK